MMKAIIIVPTYNEVENIPELCRRIRRSLDGIAYDVLVMDDSPGRHTVEAAMAEGCRAIWRTSSRGLSAAVVEGVTTVRDHYHADLVVVMDADLQHPPEALPQILRALESHDFVIASRYVAAGSCGPWGLYRRLVSRVANLLAAPLAMFKVRDLSSGFFGFRTASLGDLADVKPQGFKIMLELLVKNEWSSVLEVPYTFGSRTLGESKLSRVQVTDYLKQLVDLYLYRFRWIRFALVGASGVAVHLSVQYVTVEFLGMHYMPGAAIAFLAAVTNNYLWNSWWTFRQQTSAKAWLKYVCISLGTLALSELALYVLTGFLGMWHIFAAAIGLSAAFVLNYTLGRRLVWKR